MAGKNDSGFAFDVALSFAGEDRTYVREVADTLKSQGVKVFYDEYALVDMWGRDLYEHLHEVYSAKAKYCIVFVSAAYSRKIWTTHERKSAQERALREHQEYLLPARFDDTELPGLRSTTGYVDLRKMTPGEFASTVMKKLGKGSIEGMEGQQEEFRVPRIRRMQFNAYEEANEFISYLEDAMRKRAGSLRSAGSSLSVFKRGDRSCVRLVRDGRTLFSFDVWMGGIAGDRGLSFYATDGEIRSSSGSLNAWAEVAWDEQQDRPVLKLNDMSLFGNVSFQERTMLFDEFITRIWDRIVEIVERRKN
jgi:hypothetical protein